MRYVAPFVAQWPGTLIAVNVGGAMIPTMMSVYLLVRNRLWVQAALATAAVAAVGYWLSRPIPGLGIAEPVFVASVTAAIVALLLSREQAAPLAHIGGSLGTLISGSAQSRPHPRAGGAGGLDRRSWNLRRHLPDRDRRGADRRPP
jgi:uncharacterized membrane protein